MPPGAFGIYAASMGLIAPTPVAGTAGRLCLSGAIGRFDGPGQVLLADAAGTFRLELDPTRIEQPNGPVAAQAGQTWYFQAWFRDVQGGVATSNFSDALELGF